MRRLYRSTRTLWYLLPRRARQVFQPSGRLYGLRQRAERLFSRSLDHDEVYDAEYYRRLEETIRGSAAIMANSIVEELNPKTVIDVGCGTGALLESLGARNAQCLGLDVSEAALEVCRSRGLDVRKFDVTGDQRLDVGQFDLAISTEVAEHLPAESADRYVDLLCGLSPVILMTAATPGQGGTSHVNEQPDQYWIEKFQERAFGLSGALSQKLRAAWKAEGVAYYYYQNVLVFRYRTE